MKQLAWISSYLGRITTHVTGGGKVRAPEEPEHAEFMRILVKLMKKTQAAEKRCRGCVKELFGKHEIANIYGQAMAKSDLWKDQCSAPEIILALQTSLTFTRKECQAKVQHVVQEKEEALLKCSKEWKRAIRTAAKRMNKEAAVEGGAAMINAKQIDRSLSPGTA